MRSVPAVPFSLGVDTVLSLSPQNCRGLQAAGIKFAVRYLTGPYAIGPAERDVILSSGLALMLVTAAGAYDGMQSVRALRSLNWPAGATVWLDVEGCTETPIELAGKVNLWSHSVDAASFDPGMYVGAKSLLTSAQLYALAVDRYWHACSRLTDVAGTAQEPARGFCMRQLRPYNTQVAGVVVDVNVVEADYRDSVPMWVVG